VTFPDSARARQIIEELRLAPHPERGFYSESYRAHQRVSSASHPSLRSASTAIYFLVTADEPFTYLHRLASDEIFHLYEGGPLDILRLFPDARWDVARLGMNLGEGQRPQIMIPRGTWFGTELSAEATHCLVGCTVAPGFEFEDFELSPGSELEDLYPSARARIQRLRRPAPALGADSGLGLDDDLQPREIHLL
jgi:predicted cupin superfamily sugar epimerase